MTEYRDFEVLGAAQLSGSSPFELYKMLRDQKSSIPWRELEQRGLVSSGREIASIVPLIAHTSAEELAAQMFRQSSGTLRISALLWTAAVKRQAQQKYVGEHFSHDQITKEFLASVAQLSADNQNIGKVADHLATFGIILIYFKPFTSSLIDGVIGKLPTGNPYIGMSLRFPRIDYFWFTLLHELAHVYRHFDDLDTPILDELDEESSDTKERQANRAAAEAVVPRNIWNRSSPVYDRSGNADVVRQFAKEIGVHPALIAGRLRRERNKYQQYSDIVNEVDVRKIIWGD